jgi:hypothetical protein
LLFGAAIERSKVETTSVLCGALILLFFETASNESNIEDAATLQGYLRPQGDGGIERIKVGASALEEAHSSGIVGEGASKNRRSMRSGCVKVH